MESDKFVQKNTRKNSVDAHDLEKEVLMRKPDGGYDPFEKNWLRKRAKGGSVIHNIINQGGEHIVDASKSQYLTYTGHSTWIEGQGLKLYGITINNTVDSAIDMLNEYPNIHTINLFSCWTGSPNENEESMLLENRLELEDKSIQLSFAEKFIVELAKKAASGEIEPERIANLTVVGCMGKVVPNASGRTLANKEVRTANFDCYATYSGDGTFVSIKAGKFLEKFNTLCNDISEIKPVEKSKLITSEKSSKDMSSSDSESEEDIPTPNNPYSCLLKLGSSE